MEDFLKTVIDVNGVINDFAWGPIMLVLLVGTGIFLTIRTGFIQVSKFGWILKKTIGSVFKKTDKKDGQNLTPFQAMCTAMAGTVGTGNIAGVTGAVFVGGPGAAFWMWVSAFFGMCTKYAEIALAVKYREKDAEGAYHGGPMYYITNGLGKHFKWLAVIFAVLGGLASFGIGNISQSSEIAGAMSSLLNVPSIATGIGLAIIVAIVILGGVKRIGTVTSYLVPVMSCFYILAGIAVIVIKITDIPTAFATIFTEAFSFRAVEGAILGIAIMKAMQNGFARGVFSNEAGLGSAPIAHATSTTEEPVEQAVWGVFEVFVDTIIICTITCLTVVLATMGTGSLIVDGIEITVGGGLPDNISKGVAAVAAFNSVLPFNIAGTIIQISLLFFALSTIISWSYYGTQCWGYLTKNNKTVTMIYKVIFILVCVLGASSDDNNLMWKISDTLNGLMAIPNLIALLLLSGVVASVTKDYFGRKK